MSELLRLKSLRSPHGLLLSKRFLRWLWRPYRRGFVFLAARRAGTEHMVQRTFNLARGWPDIEKFLNEHDAQAYDLYYCPNAFSRPSRRAAFALPTPYAWCDIDGGDPGAFRPLATIVMETSPGRYQGIWRFKKNADPLTAEAFSKWLAYSYGGDRTGGSVTKLLRIAGSTNHKPQYNCPRVRIVGDIGEPIEQWPDVPKISRLRAVSMSVDPFRHDWREVIARCRKKLSHKTRRLMEDTRVVSHDRSKMIFIISAELHRAGATPDEIATVVWRSPYFISKHGHSLTRLNEEVSRILAKLGAQDD